MGGKRGRTVRFAVGSCAGPRSSGWMVVARRKTDDVYLAPLGALAGVLKLSLHSSGICRYAFTEEHGRPPTLPDRAIDKWRRKVTPPAGSGLGTRVLSLYFPTDSLSTAYMPPDRGLTWVDPAPVGGVTIVELVFIRESRENLEAVFAERAERVLVGYLKVPSGEALAIMRGHGPWESSDLEVPASDGGSALLFSARDPHGTGRPVRIQIRMMDDRDGSMAFLELGGHPVPIGSKYVPGRGGIASSLGPEA